MMMILSHDTFAFDCILQKQTQAHSLMMVFHLTLYRTAEGKSYRPKNHGKTGCLLPKSVCFCCRLRYSAVTGRAARRPEAHATAYGPPLPSLFRSQKSPARRASLTAFPPQRSALPDCPPARVRVRTHILANQSYVAPERRPLAPSKTERRCAAARRPGQQERSHEFSRSCHMPRSCVLTAEENVAVQHDKVRIATH